MVVKCLKCGSSEVTLTTAIPVEFKFDDEGNVLLATDVEAEIYWSVEYRNRQAACECAKCGHQFAYAEWEKSLEQKEAS